MARRGLPHWSNWSGEIYCTPQFIAKPGSIDELIKLVRDCARKGQHIRVAGSGHSGVPLVTTDEVLVSLEKLRGIEAIDPEEKTVTVLGGTILAHLGDELLKHGLAQENLGDIDVQTIAGAISTGTHGMGIRFGILPTQVEALTLVTASGELLECSRDCHPDIFHAALVSLGMLGIIVKVKLRVVPAKCLHFRSCRIPLADCLDNLEQYRHENEHFGFYWYPHTPWVHAKFFDKTDSAQTTNDSRKHVFRTVSRRIFFWGLSEGFRLVPGLYKPVCMITGKMIPVFEETNYSHRVLTFAPGLPHYEMEYALQAKYAEEAIADIVQAFDRHRFRVHYPLQCRFVREDDIWLSPAYQRETVYLAVHVYQGMPYQAYFAAIEDIFKHYQGRPHWGKMHTRSAEDFAQLYSRWNDFRRIRATLDPKGIFLNNYLHQLFEV
jgi:FAD-linked oxidoreductase